MKIKELVNVGFSGIQLELGILELQAMTEIRQELDQHSLGVDDRYDANQNAKNDMAESRQKELLIYFKNFLSRIVKDTPSKDEVTAKLFGNLTDDDQYIYEQGDTDIYGEHD